jgi:hypothetical protein
LVSSVWSGEFFNIYLFTACIDVPVNVLYNVHVDVTVDNERLCRAKEKSVTTSVGTSKPTYAWEIPGVSFNVHHLIAGHRDRGRADHERTSGLLSKVFGTW